MEEIVKELISRVNSTLLMFEKDYTSCLRFPGSEDRERCHSFEQYIEARFNFECAKIPELEAAIILSQGHLFRCVLLDDIDLMKRRFSWAYVEITPIVLLAEYPEDLKDEIQKVINYLGGSKIMFNNVRKKIKYTIEK